MLRRGRTLGRALGHPIQVWLTDGLWWAVVGVLVIGVQQPLPPSETPAGWGALALALAVWALLVLLGTALGRWVLRRLRLPWPSPAEGLLWALPTGLMVLGYPVYALGMLGLFRRSVLALTVGLLSVLLRREMHAVLREGWAAVRACRSLWPRRGLARWGVGLTGALMGSAWLLALTPPGEYDALWYHLQAPRLFLQAGRIYPEWNNWPANYAFAAHMLYAVPLALGTDIAPKLLHWTLGVALLLVTFSLARPQARDWAWLAPGFVLLPSFVWRLYPAALVDAATGILELMALGSLWRAAVTRERGWLRGVGLWAGLSLSVKMAALPALAAGAVFWLGWGAAATWRQRVRDLAQWLGTALLLAAPWYGKNAWWFGTPLFPVGLPAADEAVRWRSWLLSAYTHRAGQGLQRLRLLLWLVYAPRRLDYLGSIGELPLLLSTVWLPLPRAARYALLLVGLRLGWWMVGPPFPRFLLSTFALAGVVMALVVAHHAASTRRRVWVVVRAVVYGHLAALTMFTLWMAVMLYAHRPWRVALGRESRAAYLHRTVDGYAGWEFLRTLDPRSRVLMVGDARHYYCPPVCYPEADQFTWVRLMAQADFEATAFGRLLQEEGVTHLLLHRSSIQWLLEHDVEGLTRRSFTVLTAQFLPACGEEIYRDDAVRVVALRCLSTP